MGESRGGPGLTLEAAPGVAPRQEILKHLDSDVPAEPRIPRAVNLAHAARAERTLNLVRAQADADLKQHVLAADYRVGAMLTGVVPAGPKSRTRPTYSMADWSLVAIVHCAVPIELVIAH
jgi:hypothetical protein